LALIASLLSDCGRKTARDAGPIVAPQQASAAALTVPQFADRAREAGLRFLHNNGHHGPFYYPEMIGGGCALLDVDGDGWLDVFLPNGAPLPGRAVGTRRDRFSDRLYRNDHPATGNSPVRFTDITERAGVSGIAGGRKAYSIGCAVGDYD